MLSIVHRPRVMSEVMGQEIPKLILSSIIKNPDSAPRSLILAGGYGCGKTTLARIFARELNKAYGIKESDEALSNPPYYIEFDAAIVGNVETARSLRDSLAYSLSNGFKVVVFDESHLASPEAMGALLTVLELENKRTFFIFATTECEKMLKTIRSRSLVIEFAEITREELKNLVKITALKEGREVSEEAADLIAHRASGHARDAMQSLDKLFLLGEKEFIEREKSLESLFEEYIKALIAGNSGKPILDRITSHPAQYIRQDFERFIMSMADNVFVLNKEFPKGKELVVLYLKNNQLLETANDWYLFLCSLSELYKQAKVAPTTAGRFQK